MTHRGMHTTKLNSYQNFIKKHEKKKCFHPSCLSRDLNFEIKKEKKNSRSAKKRINDLTKPRNKQYY